MGGQACVFYGAAEFSRDTDLMILADAANLERLQEALDELQAVRIAVPPFEARWLERGLSVHFRCSTGEAAGMRLDVMSKMRGVAPFPDLWSRRTVLEIAGTEIDVLSIADLVRAKKTQRDKDWPMLSRLLEADFAARRSLDPDGARVEFWLRELRTPALLIQLAAKHPELTRRVVTFRPLLSLALAGDEIGLRKALRNEEDAEREADRVYWEPLKRELERLRGAERAQK
jgi:hypothetical protein